MPSKVPLKCAIPGCHRRLKMTLAEREELRRVGRENNATAGPVCPAHVKAAFNFEFDHIDIDVPLEEFLVEASKDTPRSRDVPKAEPALGKPVFLNGCWPLLQSSSCPVSSVASDLERSSR